MFRHRASTPSGSCWTGDTRQGACALNWTPAVQTSPSPRKLPKSQSQTLSHSCLHWAPQMLSPSHVGGEAPGSGLQLRRAPLGVRTVVPLWPEYLIWKNSCLAHPSNLQWEESLRSSVEGACVSQWTPGNSKWERAGVCSRGPSL